MLKNPFHKEKTTSSDDPIEKLQLRLDDLEDDIRQNNSRSTFLFPLILLVFGLAVLVFFFDVDLRKTFGFAQNDVSQILQNVSLPSLLTSSEDEEVVAYRQIIAQKDQQIGLLNEQVLSLETDRENLMDNYADIQSYAIFLKRQNEELQIFLSQKYMPDLPQEESAHSSTLSTAENDNR